MDVTLSGVRVKRGDWTLSADDVFCEGTHLVCGDVGSGKSTLALLVAGLMTPDSGQREQQGIRTSGISFQFPEFHITGRDLAGECRSWNLDPSEVLAAAGLSGRENDRPLDLSRGELKRLILSCILEQKDDLLVLDEPFSSLDCAGKDRVCSALSGRRKGITIVLTHEQSWFPRVDRIWEIEQGILRDRGPLPDALSCWNHAPAFVRNLVAAGRIPANITRNDLREAACRT